MRLDLTPRDQAIGATMPAAARRKPVDSLATLPGGKSGIGHKSHCRNLIYCAAGAVIAKVSRAPTTRLPE
jgi:hypothetical protein